MPNTWKLNESNFTFLDKLKICQFFLRSGDMWTQGKEVRKYEEQWADYVGCKYALMVSSGSTANSLIAEYSKVESPDKKIVVFPSVTWQTSVSPWINLGFDPIFVDVNLHDFSIDLEKLEEVLKSNSNNINCVFLTSLIGVTPDINSAKRLCKKYGVKLKLDNCENTFGSYKGKHICSELSCSTSLYFGHQTTTGTEGGIVFTNDKTELMYHILHRSHGLTRELKNYEATKTKKVSNKKVDALFDFYSLGNNYRSNNIAAFMGSLDFKRIDYYESKRIELYNEFNLNSDKFILPVEHKGNKNVMFCLPIISREPDAKFINKIKTQIKELGIEYRPIISGNLLRQTCYNKFDDYKKFENAEHLHNYGFYIGLHTKLKNSQVKNLAKRLNQI